MLFYYLFLFWCEVLLKLLEFKCRIWFFVYLLGRIDDWVRELIIINFLLKYIFRIIDGKCFSLICCFRYSY